MPLKQSAESNQKRRLALLGDKNHMFGKHHTPEAIEKIRLARVKYVGVNHPMYGKKHKPETIEKMSKENCHMWKGDNITYYALHYHIRKYLPKEQYCKHCGLEKRLDVANITGIYNRDLKNWLRLCRKCHMINDGNIKNLKQYNK